MIFNEIYGVYYNTMAKILSNAINNPSLDEKEIRKIINENAFNESVIAIQSAIKEERWQLILPNGTTPIKHFPTIPLTNLQKRWLKSISLDPRIQLFNINFDELKDVEPLFTDKDYYIFDKYCDGDNFKDELYIKNFRLILDAIKNKYSLEISIKNKNGNIISDIVTPEYLEYSEKDDKFRLITSNCKMLKVINLSSIVKCNRYNLNIEGKTKGIIKSNRIVTFEVIDDRNALERVLLHFSHFEKQAESIGENFYRISIKYNSNDETELLIRILSFGPMIKVIEPQSFIELIKNRLKNQKNCGL